jgi:hypothetical protein
MGSDADNFAAGLVPYRKALAERREKAMTQETSPFDDGLPDDDDLEEVEETPKEEEPKEEEPQAASPPQKQTRRRGPGKKRRGREPIPVADVAPTVEMLGATPAADEELPQASAIEGGINPKDPLIYWPKIIESARAKGMGPEYLQIRIERAGVGATPTPFILVETIEGEMVAGDETTAGQTLVDYLTNVVHMGRKVAGRAVYKLFVFYKVKSSGGFPVMTIQLDHPDEIRAQQMRRAEYFRNREAPSLGMGSHPPAPARGYQLPQQMAQPPYLSAPPPAPSFGQGGFAETLSQLQAYEEYRQGLIRAGQPAPPPAPQPVYLPAPQPPPPPPAPAPVISNEPRLSKEEEELIFEAKMARYIEKAGYVKPGMGAPAKPIEIKNQASGFKEIIQAFKELDSFKAQIAEVVGGKPGAGDDEEEPETEAKPEDKISILQIPGASIGGRPIMLPRNTKGTIDFFQQAVMANLETSQELAVKALGGVAAALDKTSFGKLLESLANKGPQAAQLAQAARASGMVGTGAVNGATPLPQRPRGPMA